MNVLRRISCTLVFACFALILHIVPSVTPIFELQWRESNQLLSYRVISCHALHWSWNHLAWDLLMFTVLGAVCEATDRFKYLSYLVLSAILIPNVVIACHPELSTYRGLSGLDSGLFAMVAVDRILESKRSKDQVGLAVFSICLLCLMIKIASETLYGGNLFVSDSSFIPVPVSHLTGAVLGAMVCLLFHEQRESRMDEPMRSLITRDRTSASLPTSNWPSE